LSGQVARRRVLDPDDANLAGLADQGWWI